MPQLTKLKDGIFYANKTLNQLEIRQKKVYLESKVRVIHANLTTRCDMKCPFCIWERNTSSWEIPESICKEIIQLFPYLQRCVWQGGESYLYPKFKEMMEKATYFPNLEQTILTNGAFLNEEWVELFSRIPMLHLVISLESVKKNTYEELRKGGNFERLKKNLNLLNSLRARTQEKIYLSMNTIVMKRNYLELEKIFDFAIENKFCQIILTPLYPNGSEFNEKEYLSPNNAEVRNYFCSLMPKLWEKSKKDGIYLADRFSGIARQEPSAESGRANCYTEFSDKAICLAPWQQLYIESNGDVKNYCHCPFIVGNINNNSINKIWNDERLIKQRQAILNYDYSLCNEICVKGTLDKSNLKLT